MHERISIDPSVCHGHACVKGTRISVHQILAMLASGDKADEIIEDFPNLKAEDIYACLAYAASLALETFPPGNW